MVRESKSVSELTGSKLFPFHLVIACLDAKKIGCQTATCTRFISSIDMGSIRMVSILSKTGLQEIQAGT